MIQACFHFYLWQTVRKTKRLWEAHMLASFVKTGYIMVQLRTASTFGHCLVAVPSRCTWRFWLAHSVYHLLLLLESFKHQTFATHGAQPKARFHKFRFLRMSHGRHVSSRKARKHFSRPCRFPTTLRISGHFYIRNMVSCSDQAKQNLSHSKIQLNLPGFCASVCFYLR